MNGLLFKDGVLPIKTIAKAGARILAALDATARRVNRDLTVTCADGEHPPTDPHTLGEAYDIRTHDMPDDDTKRLVLRSLMAELTDEHDLLSAQDGGIANGHFFGWIEHANEADEHLHVQRRKGTVYE